MENNIDTIIGLNVNVKGNLQNSGSIQVNGNVEGEIKSDEHINIGETAKVNGPVTAKTVEIAGEVSGVIDAKERLIIHPTGHVIGDISTPVLIIEQGATFIGKSAMPSKRMAENTVKPDKKGETEIIKPADAVANEHVEEKTKKEEKEEVVKANEDTKDDKTDRRDPLGFFRK